MSRRAKGYTRVEITIAENSVDSTEIWKCRRCKRWHGFFDSGTTEDEGICDECWAKDRDEDLEGLCYPCKDCGEYPEWTDGLQLSCPKCGDMCMAGSMREEDTVRYWNEQMEPKDG
jgi:hypothetical protein